MVSSMDLWEFALEGPRTRACRGQLRSLQPEPGSDLGDVRGLLALVAFDDIELEPVAAFPGAVAGWRRRDPGGRAGFWAFRASRQARQRVGTFVRPCSR